MEVVAGRTFYAKVTIVNKRENQETKFTWRTDRHLPPLKYKSTKNNIYSGHGKPGYLKIILLFYVLIFSSFSRTFSVLKIGEHNMTLSWNFSQSSY